MTIGCSGEESSNDNSDNNNNPSSEKRIYKMGIHSIQSCDDYDYIIADSLKISYNNQGFSYLQRTFEYECNEDEWTFADYNFWSDVSVQQIGNNLITEFQYIEDNSPSVNGNVLEMPLNSDGYITNIPFPSNEDGYLSWDFEYNSSYLSLVTITEIDTFQPQNIISNYSYNWQNGNIQSITKSTNSEHFGQDSYTYEYSNLLNRSKLFGYTVDYGSDCFDPLFSTFCGKPPNNLPSRIIRQRNDSGNWGFSSTRVYDYDYVLDNEGYVLFVNTSLNITSTQAATGIVNESTTEWTLELEYTN